MEFVKENLPNCCRKRWVSDGNDFKFLIHEISRYYFIVANHKTKDIRFNSLWENIQFATLEEAKAFCENFDYKKHKPLGNDV